MTLLVLVSAVMTAEVSYQSSHVQIFCRFLRKISWEKVFIGKLAPASGCCMLLVANGTGGRALPGIRKRNSTSNQLERQVEEEHGRVLTEKQRAFARLYVEGGMSNAECARQAGYSHEVAAHYASRLLNGRDFPHVLDYVKELREERERRYGVTLIGQLERLYALSRGAEGAGQYSAAINAEKIRSALGGLTIDRRETINTLDQLSRDEITARLVELQRKYPHAFVIEGTATEVRDVKRSRVELLGIPSAESSED
jgi:hypothetical protein